MSSIEQETAPVQTSIAKSASARARTAVTWIVALGLTLTVGWWLGRGSARDRLLHTATSGAGGAVDVTAAGSPPAAPAPATSEDARRAHQAAASVPPAAAAVLDGLRQRVEASPDDLAARKELAVRLVEADQLVEAFEHAELLMKADANDPDGLYVEGEVRLAMGQVPRAIEMLDRVLTQHPDHLLALIARGKASARSGQAEDATTRWERALSIAGGRYPPVEALLAEIRSGSGLGSQSGAGMAPPAVSELQLLSAHTRTRDSGAPPPAAASGAEQALRVRVELPAESGSPAGGTLFVALRSAAGGPPAAVKRISSPSFPLDLTLDSGDSMMGQSLPQSGRLTVRLDADGDASTQGAGDLTGSAEATLGDVVTIRLLASR